MTKYKIRFRSFLCTASAAALEPKVCEQVRLTLGGGQTRLHVREAKLLAGADGPQRTDHEAAWTLNKGVELATMRDAGSSSPRGEGKRRGAPAGSPLRLGVTGGSSGPRPPGARLGVRHRRELGPCQGVDGAGRGATRPCSAAACIEAPVHVGVAAMVEHRHGRAQAHAHLRAHARGRRRHRRRRHSGRPPARLGWGRTAVALLRRVFVQGEGVAVDLGGSREGGRLRGSAWEE